MALWNLQLWGNSPTRVRSLEKERQSRARTVAWRERAAVPQTQLGARLSRYRELYPWMRPGTSFSLTLGGLDPESEQALEIANAEIGRQSSVLGGWGHAQRRRGNRDVEGRALDASRDMAQRLKLPESLLSSYDDLVRRASAGEVISPSEKRVLRKLSHDITKASNAANVRDAERFMADPEAVAANPQAATWARLTIQAKDIDVGKWKQGEAEADPGELILTSGGERPSDLQLYVQRGILSEAEAQWVKDHDGRDAKRAPTDQERELAGSIAGTARALFVRGEYTRLQRVVASTTSGDIGAPGRKRPGDPTYSPALDSPASNIKAARTSIEDIERQIGVREPISRDSPGPLAGIIDLTAGVGGPVTTAAAVLPLGPIRDVAQGIPRAVEAVGQGVAYATAPLKPLSRALEVAGMAGPQLIQAGFRDVASNVEEKGWVRGLTSSELPELLKDGDEALESIHSLTDQTYVGQIANAYADGREIDLGSGYGVGYESEIGKAQTEAAREAAPLIGGSRGTHAWSIGRALTQVAGVEHLGMEDPDKGWGKVLSGVADAAVVVKGDITPGVLNAGPKALRRARGFVIPGQVADTENWSGIRKLWNRPTATQYVDTDPGFIPHAEEIVKMDAATVYVNGRAGGNALPVKDQVNGDPVLLDLGGSMSVDDVREVVRPTIGREVRGRITASPTRSRVRQWTNNQRWLGQVPDKNFDPYNPDQVLAKVHDDLRNENFPWEDTVIGNTTIKGQRSILNDTIETLSNPVLDPAAATRDVAKAVGNAMEARLYHLNAPKLTKLYSKATGHRLKSEEAELAGNLDKAAAQAKKANKYDEAIDKLSGKIKEVTRAFPHIESEMRLYASTDAMHGIDAQTQVALVKVGDDMLPTSPHALNFSQLLDHPWAAFDAREIRDMTRSPIWAAFTKYSGIHAAQPGLDFVSQKVWKPLTLIRPAWTLRVIAEEQARIAGAGYDSLFAHPLRALAIIASDNGDFGRMIRKIDQRLAKIPGTRHIMDFGENGRLRFNALGQLADQDDSFIEAMGTMTYNVRPGATATGRLGWDFSGVGDSQFPERLANELAMHATDEFSNLVARSETLGQAQQRFLQDFGKVRTRLTPFMPYLRDDAAAKAHVGLAWTELQYVTGGDPTLLSIARTGKHEGEGMWRLVDAENGIVDRTRMNPAMVRAVKNRVDAGVGPKQVRYQRPMSNAVGGKAKAIEQLDKAMNNAFAGLMGIPTAKLSRSVVFRQLYWEEVSRLTPSLSDVAYERVARHAKRSRTTIPARGIDIPGDPANIGRGPSAPTPRATFIDDAKRSRELAVGSPQFDVDEFHYRMSAEVNRLPLGASSTEGLPLESLTFEQRGEIELAAAYRASGKANKAAGDFAHATTPDARMAANNSYVAAMADWADHFGEATAHGVGGAVPREILAPWQHQGRDLFQRQGDMAAELGLDPYYYQSDAFKPGGPPLHGQATSSGEDPFRDELDALDDLAYEGVAGPGDRRDLTAEGIDFLAKSYALEGTKKLLYDLRNKSQFFDMFRVLFPFGEAWKEVLHSWSRIVSQRPGTLRQAQRVIGGAQDAGIIHEDANGRMVYSFPSTAFTGAASGAAVGSFGGPAGAAIGAAVGGAAGLYAESQLDAPVPFEASALGLNLIGQGLPGVGPVASFVPGQLLRDKPDADWVMEIMFPYGSNMTGDIPADAARALAPQWAERLLTAISAPDSDRLYMNTVTRLYESYVSSGKWDVDPDNPHRAEELNAAMAEARKDARWVYLIRAFGNASGPSAPTPVFQAKDLENNWIDLEIMRQHYYDIVDDKSIEDPFGEFLKRYGTKNFLVPQPMSDSGAVSIPSTKDFAQWEADHKRQKRDFPETYAFFGPDGGEYDQTVYQRQIAAGDREGLTTQEVSDAANDRLGRHLYQLKSDEVPASKRSDAQRKWFDEFRDHLETVFPGYGFGEYAPAELDASIRQITRASKSKGLRDLPVSETIRTYLSARKRVEEATGTFSGWRTSKEGAKYREWLAGYGESLIEDDPTFRPAWDRLFVRETYDPRWETE